MNTQEERALLRNFFSAYFHEDWPCDAETPEAVVAGYMRRAKVGDMRSLGAAIRSLCREFSDDRDLEITLFRDLGSYYRPSLDSVSARAWLEGVARELLREHPS